MAAKIGILGESTSVTSGSVTTVYTVPTSKAARIRIMFGLEGGATGTSYEVLIGVPGSERTIVRVTANDSDVYSGFTGGATQLSNTIGIVDAVTSIELVGGAVDHVMAPFPHDYFLSTGDTVRFQIITNNGADHLFQVVGVEDDA